MCNKKSPPQVFISRTLVAPFSVNCSREVFYSWLWHLPGTSAVSCLNLKQNRLNYFLKYKSIFHAFEFFRSIAIFSWTPKKKVGAWEEEFSIRKNFIPLCKLCLHFLCKMYIFYDSFAFFIPGSQNFYRNTYKSNNK